MEYKAYCAKCGLELVKGDIYAYDSETGKPKHNYICPSGECFHSGVNHDYSRKSGFLGFLNFLTGRCTKCGYVESDSGC